MIYIQEFTGNSVLLFIIQLAFPSQYDCFFMQIVTDKNYCRLCRQININQHNNRTNYCQKCRNNIALKKEIFNRWNSSKTFIETSFSDCIDSDYWNGFTDIKFNVNLINKLINKFSELNYLISTSERKILKNYQNSNFLNLLSDKNNELLKIGQTQNLINRLNRYYNISSNKPIYYHIFNVDTYDKQDLYEEKIRNYLEFLGYILPADNTGLRLKYIPTHTKTLS
jgi:hypothetical protein